METNTLADRLFEQFGDEAQLHLKMAREAETEQQREVREAKAVAFMQAQAMVDEEAPSPSTEETVKNIIRKELQKARRTGRTQI